MGCDKKDKCKCKKNCKTVMYYYDTAKLVRADPVFDTYAGVGGDQSYSVFLYGTLYQDLALTIPAGTLELNNKVLQNTNTNPVQLPKVVLTTTAFFKDGVTSVSSQIYYSATDLLLTAPPGIYKTVAYSTTGLYYDKDFYITITIPSVGGIVSLQGKSCDRKSCA